MAVFRALVEMMPGRLFKFLSGNIWNSPVSHLIWRYGEPGRRVTIRYGRKDSTDRTNAGAEPGRIGPGPRGNDRQADTLARCARAGGVQCAKAARAASCDSGKFRSALGIN